MIDNSLIKTLKNELHEKCTSNSNKFGYEIWKYHMIPVIEFAKELAVALDADQEIVEISAILHDYASVKDYALYKEHHIHGANEAEKLLIEFDYPEEKINRIKECIVQHRGSIDISQSTIESICVASADAMSHISNVTSLLHLAYTKRNLSIEDGALWVKKKINRSWDKLCPEAKEIVKKKYENALYLLDENISC